MRRYVLLLASVLTLAGGVSCSSNSAERRVRQHFNIPKGAHLDSTTIRDAILKEVPLGTPLAVVVDYLERRGVVYEAVRPDTGLRALSSYHWLRADELLVHIGYDHRQWRLVYWSANISFEFGPDRRLARVGVYSGLTGL